MAVSRDSSLLSAVVLLKITRSEVLLNFAKARVIIILAKLIAVCSCMMEHEHKSRENSICRQTSVPGAFVSHIAA